MRNGSERAKKLQRQREVALPHDLTYKSSVHDSCIQAGLTPYRIELPPKQRAWRYMFASAQFLAWLRYDMPHIQIKEARDIDPLNIQVEREFFGFAYGHTLSDTLDIRCLEPQPKSVWELKTPDLRLFGWFPAKDYFVVHAAKEKEGLTWRDYGPFVQEVDRFRLSLAQWMPNYVTGGLWNVVSNRA